MTRSTVPSRALALLLLAAGAPGLTVTDARAETREAMADAMVRMMEAMGMFNPSGSSMPMGTPFGAPGFRMPGGSPWGMPGGMPGGTFPWAPGSGLEGVWEGRNGELLIVQGDRFRIYPGSAGYLEGQLKLSGDRLAMYSPQDDEVRPFEYAEKEGRLVLRDDAGSLYLYRRLRLGEPPGPSGPPGGR
jgi:hypothetical protein